MRCFPRCALKAQIGETCMPKQIVCALVGLFLFVAGCPVPPDTADMMDGTAEARRFTATLSGDNEVPAVDSDATGTATLELNEDETELTYTVNVAGEPAGESTTAAGAIASTSAASITPSCR